MIYEQITLTDDTLPCHKMAKLPLVDVSNSIIILDRMLVIYSEDLRFKTIAHSRMAKSDGYAIFIENDKLRVVDSRGNRMNVLVIGKDHRTI